MSVLLSGSVWGRISKLSQSSLSTLAAAPYFGSGATNLLSLKEGDTLVVKFDREAIGTGQVDPREIIKAIKKGVNVHSCANLHAKVYVFGKTAVVGSSNVSQNSERHLLEACVETTEKNTVSSVRRFIKRLLGDRVGLDYAQEMVSFYRPPIRSTSTQTRTRKNKQLPVHSDLWLVSLVEGGWRDIDYEQAEKGRPEAKKALKNPRSSRLDEFNCWEKNLSRYKVGLRIILCTKTSDGEALVSPPARVVKVQKYTAKGKRRAIIYLETPKKYRRRKIDAVLRSLGPNATHLGNPRRTKQLRQPELVYALGRLWP